MQDIYGNFVNNYTTYTDTPNGMEVVIGRRPAVTQLGDLTGLTVLDFGCGPATNAADLYRQGASQVIGIDISEEELAVTRQIDPNGIYLHYDGIHLANAVGRRVDAILASFSFCTIPTAPLESLLKDMRTLLRVGGRLVIIDPNLEQALGVHYPGELHYHAKTNPQTDDHIHVTLGEGEQAVELYHDIYRTHDDYRRVLAKAGFTIEEFFQPVPPDSCRADWAEVARKYPPFLTITAH